MLLFLHVFTGPCRTQPCPELQTLSPREKKLAEQLRCARASPWAVRIIITTKWTATGMLTRTATYVSKPGRKNPEL